MKPERWWRAYEGAVHDPKVQTLPDWIFKLWFNLLCLASKNDGVVPSMEQINSVLNLRLDRIKSGIETLLSRGLIDQIEGRMEPHNWRKRQYKSDVSTERTRRHRERSRDVPGTPPDNRVQNTDKSVLTNTLSKTGFDEFWEAFPKRDGFNPRPKAEAAFNSIVEAGTDPARLIETAHRYATQVSAIEPRYIPQAVTWLNDRGWEQIPSTKTDLPTIKPGQPEWDAWERYYLEERKSLPLAMQRVKDGQQKTMTVPARLPEEFDSGYAAAIKLKRRLDGKAP